MMGSEPLLVESEIAVELCGCLADADGRVVIARLAASGTSAGALMTGLAARYPALAAALGRGRVRACVNDVVVGPDARIGPGDRVALFPPVSGG